MLRGGDIWNWYLASAFTSVVTVILTVVFASMAAYAISRLRFRGRRLVFALMLGGIMIPPQVLIVPVFQQLNFVGLLNTYWAVILPQVPSVLVLFVLQAVLRRAAAGLRGGGPDRRRRLLDVYARIVLPLSRPILAAMAIVTFVGVWNNLILPLFVLSNPDLMTIPVGLATGAGLVRSAGVGHPGVLDSRRAAAGDLVLDLPEADRGGLRGQRSEGLTTATRTQGPRDSVGQLRRASS